MINFIKTIMLSCAIFISSSYAGIAPPAPPPPQNFLSPGGSITDATGTCDAPFANALLIDFNVEGFELVNPISGFVSLAIGHTFVGDLIVKLIAPDNTELTLFARVGLDRGTPNGFGDNLSSTDGSYVFGRGFSMVHDLWTTPAINGVVPSGNYLTRESGSALLSNEELPAETFFDSTFAHLSTPNGVWRLCVADAATGDTGSVTNAQLTLNNIVPVDDFCVPIKTQDNSVTLICL